MGIDRRTFIKAGAAGVGLAGIGRAARADVVSKALGAVGIATRPARTPVKHLVVVMMENRSLDHLLGWHGAENANFDAHQHAQYRDLRQGAAGPLVSTANWGQHGRNNFHGRGFEDPSHGWDGGRAERNGGAADGWLDPRTGNDEFALSYYDAVDVPVWAQLARNYQSYDRWHCSLLGPTEPNRYYMHSGQSGGLKNNDLPPSVANHGHPEWRLGWDWPTVWTLFEQYGITSAYYFSNLPVLAYWGARHVRQMRHISEYYAAAEAGQLPQVSFIDPFFTMPDDLGNDDHPHADLRLGQAFLSDVVEAFTASSNYRDSAMVVTYDEWGGFFDHVAPPQLPDDRGTPLDPGGPKDFGQIGFRIPSTIISPWTRGGGVDHTLYEHTSVVRFMSENWHLPYLTKRERSTNSIEHAFGDFAHRDNNAAFVPYEAPLSAVQDAVTDAIAGSAPVPMNAPGMYRLAETGWYDNLRVRTDWKLEDSYRRSRPELLAAARARR